MATKFKLIESAIAKVKNAVSWVAKSGLAGPGVQALAKFREPTTPYWQKQAGQYIQNRYVQPVKDIPKNIRTVVSPKSTLLERGIGALGTLGGVATFIPDPIQDVAMPVYDLWKGISKGTIQNLLTKDVLKTGIESMSWEKPVGLGEAVTKDVTKSNLLSMAELPVLLAAGVAKGRFDAKKMKQLTPTIKEAKSLLSGWDYFKPADQMKILDKVENAISKIGYKPSKELKDFLFQNPVEYRNFAMGLFNDALYSASHPELRLGMNIRKLRTGEVTTGAESMPGGGKIKLRVRPEAMAPESTTQVLGQTPSITDLQSKILSKTGKGLPQEVPPAVGTGGQALSTIIPPGQKQKSLLETIQESKQTTTPLGGAVGGLEQGYVPITNKATLKSAEKFVAETPNVAKERILSAEPPTAEKTALAEVLIKKYEKENNIDEAIEIVESLDKQLRESGQFIQAVSMWNKLSPASMVRAVEKYAKKVNFTLEADVKRIVYDKMLGIQKIKDISKRDNAILELLNYVAEKMPATKGEIFEAYRYQNMLSGWKTHERNIYQNLFNTFITRPADLAVQGVYDFAKHPFNPVARDVQLSAAPTYFKNVFTSIPNALHAAKEAFKRGYSPNKLDFGRADTTLGLLRKQTVPKQLSVIPRLMEAEDRFFSSLIATGEKARLLKNGVSEELANLQAVKTAEKYLVRSKLGEEKGLPIFAKALDSLGTLILQGRKLPVIGKPWGWFVPFVTTPINAAKMMVEHSPLGLIGGKYSTEQLAKATTGSIVTGLAAILAMQGRTTWQPPTDPTEKELYYASGVKPYSVIIGDNYVPFWYLGPFALAMAIPAAAKYFSDQSRTALTDTKIEKLTKIAGGISRYVFSQTPLSNTAGFLQMLDGDVDINMGSLTGFAAGQIIPYSGFIRNVNQLLDPVYRKTKGFVGSLTAGIPILSKKLPAYTNPLGEPSKRIPLNLGLPYDVGQANKKFEPMLNLRTKELQQNAVINKMEKDMEEKLNQLTGTEVKAAEEEPMNMDAMLEKKKVEMEEKFLKKQFEYSSDPYVVSGSKLFYHNDDGGVSSLDLKFEVPEPKYTGEEILDEEIKSNYKSDLTKAKNAVMKAFDIGYIDQGEAMKQLAKLKLQNEKTKKGRKLKAKKAKFIPLKFGKAKKITGITKIKAIKSIKPPKLKIPKL